MENNDRYSEYAKMPEAGISPVEAYRIAEHRGLDPIACMAMVKVVYGLSIAELKDVSIKAYNPEDSLYAMQGRLASELKEYIDSLDEDGNEVDAD
ncbi:MAG: hypothetical protein H6670_05460 [Anaerolineaceae bacterium]|nr:hypothetical protein [Anaerolineaceae bacterium]